MSDTPKFEVIDRRKFKAEEEQESQRSSAPPAEPEEPSAGPQLVVNENKRAPEPVAAGPASDVCTEALAIVRAGVPAFSPPR